MKLIILSLCLIIMISASNARSFNTYYRNEKFGNEAINVAEDDPVVNETWADFYFGMILGWQTQQINPGQCHRDTASYWTSLNDTLNILLVAWKPSFWFNFLDRIRINIDSYSKSLQSCQVHTVLTKLQRIVTVDGLIETAARLLTQVAFLGRYWTSFLENLFDGNMTDSGIQLGLLFSSITGVTVN